MEGLSQFLLKSIAYGFSDVTEFDPHSYTLDRDIDLYILHVVYQGFILFVKTNVPNLVALKSFVLQ